VGKIFFALSWTVQGIRRRVIRAHVAVAKTTGGQKPIDGAARTWCDRCD
jgi:hypothetical protein